MRNIIIMHCMSEECVKKITKQNKKRKKTVTLASFLDNFVLESHRWFESVMPEAAAFSIFPRH